MATTVWLNCALGPRTRTSKAVAMACGGSCRVLVTHGLMLVTHGLSLPVLA